MFVAQLVGCGLTLWLAVFVATRSQRHGWLFWVSISSLLAQAAFFASGVLGRDVATFADVVRLERWFWWSSVLPIATWLWFCGLVLQHWQPTFHRWLLIERSITVVLAAALIVVGTTTNNLLAYDQPIQLANNAQTIGSGAGYPLFGGFVVLCGGLAITYLLLVWRSSDAQTRQRLASLIVGAGLMLIGATTLAVRFISGAQWSLLWSYSWIFAGLLATSIGIARFGLLLDGQNVLRDVLASLAEMLVLQAIYAGVLAMFADLAAAQWLALVSLVVLSHGLLDRARNGLDRVFFSRAEQQARSESRDFAATLASTPVDRVTPPISKPDKQWNDAVRKAITGLKNPPRLAQNPLLNEPFVGQRVRDRGLEDNRLNRLAALREILIEAIEHLRPSSVEAVGTGEAWRSYNVLYLPYVREINRSTAINELRRLHEERRRTAAPASADETLLLWLADVDEDTFYKWQRRASDLIAAQLWESKQPTNDM